jgi:phytoene synthase
MNGGTLPEVQPGDWAKCQSIAQTHGRSFFFASRLLRGDRRRSILAAYAYCRLADDIVDKESGDDARLSERLADWEDELERPVHPVAVAFAHTRMCYQIPERPVRELFDGMRADLSIYRYGSWPELRGYCYQVAGTVGLIVAPILGCSEPAALPRAAELGIAMQLTNILRDVKEDAAMGRVYLPLDELERFGIDPDALHVGEPGSRFPELMQFQITRARALYASALTGVSSLSPSGQLTTLAAARLYAGILDQIEANQYDVFSARAVVPRNRKARSTAGAAVQFLQFYTASARSAFRNESSNGRAMCSREGDIEGWIP